MDIPFQSFCTTHQIDHRVARAIQQNNFTTMTYSQHKALELSIADINYAISAQTGSGKTLIYIISLLHHIINNPSTSKPSCIILVPNKELTTQVQVQFNKMLKYLKSIRVFNLLNNENSIMEFNSIKDITDIVISTPASLMKTWRKVDLNLSAVQHLVIDEADLMLEYGHKDYIVQLLNSNEAISNTNIMLLSATLHEKNFLKWKALVNCSELKYLNCNPTDESQGRNIDEWKILLDTDDKILLLVSMFKLNLIPLKALIFVNSVEQCYFLKIALDCFAISTELVVDEQSIETRESTFAKFNKGEIDVLVTFDYSHLQNKVKTELDEDDSLNPGILRGIDFTNVGTVINYEFPANAIDQMHRIGRTGRGHRKGMALSLVKYNGLFDPENHDNRNKFKEYQRLVEFESLRKRSIKSLEINIQELYCLKQRVNDVITTINKSQIRKVRDAELRKSVINSEMIQNHLRKNQNDMEVKKKLMAADFKLAKVFPQFKQAGILPDQIMAEQQNVNTATINSLAEENKFKRKRDTQTFRTSAEPSRKNFKGRWWLKNRPN